MLSGPDLSGVVSGAAVALMILVTLAFLVRTVAWIEVSRTTAKEEASSRSPWVPWISRLEDGTSVVMPFDIEADDIDNLQVFEKQEI
jgi:hypothetical protein